MDTDQPTRPATTQSGTQSGKPSAATGRRSASLLALGAAYVVGVVLMIVQSIGYHHYVVPKDGTVGSDIPVYVVSGLFAALIAGIGLLRARRSRKPASTPRVAILLSVLGIAIFPVAYYTPLTFIWGITAYLLSRDAEPGPLRTAARVLGIVALCLTPLVVVLRLVGVTYQVGG
jgi:hypothetical protein